MLISSSELAAHLGDSAFVVFDCRHDLMDHAKGINAYNQGHIPGSRFAPVETALSGQKNGSNGRHPLPDPANFASFLLRHGVTDTSTIIAYDDAGGLYAARFWWMVRWIGLNKVGLLDGGWQKWLAQGLPVTTETPEPAAASSPLKLRVSQESVVRVSEVEARLGSSDHVVLDARAAERFRGQNETIDPVAGRIPGALNRFYKANLNPDLTFRNADELKREFTALLGSVSPQNVAHQCGSGITACANLFAMELAGLTGSKLYAGSWSEWISDPARPVAKG